jgi:hypothetical protein
MRLEARHEMLELIFITLGYALPHENPHFDAVV